MKSEINKLVGLAYASEIFIQDQPDLIQKKINEFSSKKSKRDYEKKHYSNEEYNYIDIPYVNVKAYSDKTWHCKSTYGLRWCGEGRKEAKIVFDYKIGEDFDQPSMVSIFKEDDPEDFIL